jgi:hypothetical protein
MSPCVQDVPLIKIVQASWSIFICIWILSGSNEPEGIQLEDNFTLQIILVGSPFNSFEP